MTLSERQTQALADAAKNRMAAYRAFDAAAAALRDAIAQHVAAGTDRAVITRAATHYGAMTREGVRQIIEAAEADPVKAPDVLPDLIEVATARGHAVGDQIATTDRLVDAMWRAREAGQRPAEIVAASRLSEKAGYAYLALRESWRELQKIFEDEPLISTHRRLRTMWVAPHPVSDPDLYRRDLDDPVQHWLDTTGRRVLADATDRLVNAGWQIHDHIWDNAPALRVTKPA